MREILYTDLLTSFHYILVVGFLVLISASLLLFRFSKGRKKLRLVSCLILSGLIFIGITLREGAFPGGGFYDTHYDSGRVEIIFIQEELKNYKNLCKTFPTTSQGLKLLTENQKDPKCLIFKSKLALQPKFKYFSDGEKYIIESNEDYGIRGLFIRGTESQDAALYIRE